MTGLPLRGKKPPFAKQLANRLASGWKPANRTVCIAAGAVAWKLAYRWEDEPKPSARAFLCAPPDMDPREFDWGVVKRLEAFAFDTGGLTHYQSNLLAVAVLACGATLFRVVYDLYGPASRIECYRPSHKVAA